MFINYSAYYPIFDNAHEMVFQKSCVEECMTDLYTRYHLPIEVNFALKIYNQETLYMKLLDQAPIDQYCKLADTLFFPSYGYCYDDNFSVPQLHLKNKMKWDGALIDVRDCGSLCVFYAIHLMLAMSCHYAAFFSVENKTPLTQNNIYVPAFNYIGFLSCSKILNHQSKFEIMTCAIFYEINLSDLQHKIDELLSKFDILKNHYSIYIKNIIWEDKNSFSVNVLLYPTSSGFIYHCLDAIKHHLLNKTQHTIFLIDFDFHEKKSAILLLKTVA